MADEDDIGLSSYDREFYGRPIITFPEQEPKLDSDLKIAAKIGGIAFAVTVLCIGSGMAGCPAYGVYSARMSGQAQLAEALASKQVAVQAAKAKYESADYEAKAAVRQAEGIRDANAKIADGLGGPEGYLRYLMIEALKEGHGQVVYVPTEAGLPILEAGKRPALAVKP